ncbi:MAG: glycosyltransferase family 4 protein [Actinobacteria bacterium]|nr:glycosyltransferase family 4 protein [Actinomycetota bacterium]
MRVTFLTHYYPPEVGAPQARISALARGLASRGHEVQVHTPPPHYPDGRIPHGYRNRLLTKETRDGVGVRRSAVLPAPNRGFARRLADHASFGLTAVAAAGRTGAADVVVAETPPLFLAAAAIPYARRKRAALVLNVSDLWPRSAIELGALRFPPAIAAAHALERRAYRSAAAVVCPTQGIEADLEARPESAGKVRRILTGVDLDAFDPAPRTDSGGFRVVYAGTTGMAQGVGTLLDAAALLARAHPDAELRIAGDGADTPELQRRAQSLGNVTMLGRIPHDEVPALLADTDAVAVLLRDKPVFEGAVPTKLLEALAAGRPVVLAAGGEAATLLRGSGGGLVVPPERPDALAEAVTRLAGDPDGGRAMGAAGRAFAEAELGIDRFVGDWERLLATVATTRGAG